MNSYREQVSTAVRAVIFHSPTSYSWLGKLSQQLPAAIKRELTQKTAQSYLLYNLQFQLYRDFYCQGFVVPAKQEVSALPVVGRTPFVERLSAANNGTGFWENGWDVLAIEDGKVVVRREGLVLRVRPKDCLAPEENQIVPDMRLSLGFPKEFLGISPGFYMALSNTEFKGEDYQNLVRFYWNLTPEGAVSFMKSATSMLNRALLPFKLKVLNEPSQFNRCDAVVLYICRQDYQVASQILEEIHAEVAANLRQGTPIFTKSLASGLGMAENPGQGESFGLSRCQILAEGIIQAHEQDKKSINERFQVVENCFAEHGISLERPYLNPGSSDDYTFQPRFHKRLQLSQNKKQTPKNISVGSFLQIADEIGSRLSQDAVWHQDRCNWLGFLTDGEDPTNGQPSLTYRALGPDLYSGTSGVALFLAELYSATGEAAARRTALGAIHQALSQAEGPALPNPLGFYSGRTGTVFATARVGKILSDEEILERAKQLLRHSISEKREEWEFDLLYGNAGAIITLLALQYVLDDTSLLDFALLYGDELLQRADRSNTGYSWRSAIFPSHRNLTGFSHGTAGAGYALMELFNATGEAKYREAAEEAFNYERHLFDAEAGNWPDLREMPGRRGKNRHALSFSTTWCHGAPGIALSRLRAHEINRDKSCKAEAMIALQTTYRTTETWLQHGAGNFSLCHGLAGNAEVLLYGSQVLGEEWADGSRLALKIADAGIETYAKRGVPWPCGVGGGENPSLMLGLSGIGHFYLRLHDPSIPPILILQRENLLS